MIAQPSLTRRERLTVAHPDLKVRAKFMLPLRGRWWSLAVLGHHRFIWGQVRCKVLYREARWNWILFTA